MNSHSGAAGVHQGTASAEQPGNALIDDAVLATMGTDELAAALANLEDRLPALRHNARMSLWRARELAGATQHSATVEQQQRLMKVIGYARQAADRYVSEMQCARRIRALLIPDELVDAVPLPLHAVLPGDAFLALLDAERTFLASCDAFVRSYTSRDDVERAHAAVQLQRIDVKTVAIVNKLKEVLGN